jgi:spermidine/putrescine transport system permease protein
MTKLRQKLLEQKAFPLYALPGALWIGVFLFAPLLIVIVCSFLKRAPTGALLYEFTIENYARALDPIFLRIIWESFQLALLTAFSCLLLGYPVAYVLATVHRPWRTVLMILLIIPFWTNLVVRTFAVRQLIGDQGPLNQWLINFGFIEEPIHFLNSFFAVYLGMVLNYLPFMVLPLYVTLEKFDFTLLEAARDLGASSWNTLKKVLLPLTKPGMITGFILVFTPSLGEFLIPDLLGGARTMLVGNLVSHQFLKVRDWPFGSALSLLLMAVVMLSLVIIQRNWKHGSRKNLG